MKLVEYVCISFELTYCIAVFTSEDRKTYMGMQRSGVEIFKINKYKFVT